MSERYSVHTTMRWQKGERTELEDPIIREAPLTIYLNGKEMVSLLCTPEYQEDLALGFLTAEGLLEDPDDLLSVRLEEEQGAVWVETLRTPQIAEQLFLKRFITTGCGKGTTFYNVMDHSLARQERASLMVRAGDLVDLMREVQQKSELYRLTGGVHSAALCQGREVLLFREDVGRHNAADKIMGYCFRHRIPMEDKVLLTSGRISSEILLKAAKMGIGAIVSRSAPTDLALQLAEELGITVIGFVRGSRMNIYTCAERVIE